MPLPHFLRHFFCYDPFPDMLPRRERRKPSLMHFIPIADFNPRSREGSDCSTCETYGLRLISIHAPARGATFWGICAKPISRHFNPRSREGSDWHTLTGRACRIHFNPRSREGSDDLEALGFDSIAVFQSTLPRGERPGIMNLATFRGIFQSTLPRGERRLQLRFSRWGIRISIHAPARGATTTTWQPRQTSYNFNPRSREGSDHDRGRCEGNGDDFNPRSREGSDI